MRKSKRKIYTFGTTSGAGNTNKCWTLTAIHFSLMQLHQQFVAGFSYLASTLCTFVCTRLRPSFFSCGCTLTLFTAIYLFLSSLLHLQKCLHTVHQGASMDSLSISPHLPLILTLLRLYNGKTTPQGTLFIPATMFTENTQRTSWSFKSAIEKGRRAWELALLWPMPRQWTEAQTALPWFYIPAYCLRPYWR